MAKEFQRSQRVASLIQEVIAKSLLEYIQDPLFKFVTVTHVDVSRDLSFAKIYVTIHDQEKIKETIKKLNDQKKYFRYQIAQEVILRRAPDLRFYYDEKLAESNRVFELLEEI